jgi:hypothetical protein
MEAWPAGLGAHELNNPLRDHGFQLIRRDRSCQRIWHNADLLVEETTDGGCPNLLDSRGGTAGAPPTSIRALRRASSRSGLRPGRRIESSSSPTTSHPWAKSRQLQQVLVNLTHNAFYAIRGRR